MSRLRWLTAGESHGPELTAIVEGAPAGVELTAELVDRDLARRQLGYGRGGRMKIEKDRVRFTGGVRGGRTLGGPISLVISNRDHENWLDRMGAAPFETTPAPLREPRPGHADLAGALKYDRRDLRDILERASARETAARVAAGAIAKAILALVGVDIAAHVVRIGAVECPEERFASLPMEEVRARVSASDVGCVDDATSEAMRAHILETAHQGDTLGGIIEVVAVGCPPGLGSHVQWDRKLDGRLAQAFMSIQAIKGVEIGLGFRAAARPGSRVHDPIGYDAETRSFTRASNGAGGVEGGISNGAPIVCRLAMKPIATLKRALGSVDIDTKASVAALHERSDVCAVPAAAVIAEAMMALALADAALETFGGDSAREFARNASAYAEQLRGF
ncbi:MAG: chorismate synthase [Polyangiaceae bacterium]